MGIRFVLLVNKQGQTRLAQYYEHLTIQERRALEGEIVRKCLTRTENQVLLCPSRHPSFHLFFVFFYFLYPSILLLDLLFFYTHYFPCSSD